MKKTLTILTAVLLSVLTAQATRALRLPVTISQPDGTVLTLYQHGDEDHHWTTTADGTLVIYTQQGCFVAAIGGDGELTATRTLAHDADHRTSAERQLAMQQTEAKRALFHERGLQRQTAAAARRAQISETGAVSFDFVTIDKGDVNADEHVNTADIVATTAIILGRDSGNARRADINGDGKVDVSDVTALAAR